MVNWCKARGRILEERWDWKHEIEETRVLLPRKGTLRLEQIVTAS